MSAEPNIFDLSGDLDRGTTTSGSSATITFPDGLRWRVPWRAQARWFVDLVWTQGWAAVWEEGLWWRDMMGKVTA